MSDNGTDRHEDAEALRIKAEHKQALARIDNERELAMAEADARSIARMPLSLRMLIDERLRARIQSAAESMAKAEGFVPKHLLGKTEPCMVVILRSFTWKLDPYAVAMATYTTPDGKIGIEGKLARAILEASGEIRGMIKQEWYGDWSQLPRPSFKMVSKARQDGRKYEVPEPAWDYWGPQEKGLGVRISAILAETGDEMELKFDLVDAYPRNATTWPTRPKLQLLNPAIRAFANMVRPSLLMGVNFADEGGDMPLDEPRDVTPARPMQPLAPPTYVKLYSAHGEEFALQPGEVAQWIAQQVRTASGEELDTLIENNPGRDDLHQACIAQAANRQQKQPLGPIETHTDTGVRQWVEPITGKPPLAPAATVMWGGKAYERLGAARSAALRSIAQAKTHGDFLDLMKPARALAETLAKRGLGSFADEINGAVARKLDGIARDIIAEIGATDPHDVQATMQDHAVSLAALPDELRTEVTAAAMDREAGGLTAHEDDGEFFDYDQETGELKDKRESDPDELFEAWTVGMRHAISNEKPEFLIGTKNRYIAAARLMGDDADEAAAEVEAAYAARTRGGGR